jgi:hypothetical protein
MIGYDDRFPHFILLVTQDNVRIIAQESVTEFPGGGTFSRFSTVLNIAPDGSSVIFRGESTTGANGVFRWTEEGIEKIADSSTNIPGSDQSFNSFFDSSIESQLGVDGAVYLFNLQPSTLVSFQNGQLSTLLNVGDVVGGQPVEGISEFDLAPDGSVFVADFTRELRFQNGEWSVFQPFVGFETADGKSLNATHFVGDAEVSFRYGADLSGLAESASAAIEIGASQANGEFETKQFRSPVPMDASASGFLGMVVRLND